MIFSEEFYEIGHKYFILIFSFLEWVSTATVLFDYIYLPYIKCEILVHVSFFIKVG